MWVGIGDEDIQNEITIKKSHLTAIQKHLNLRFSCQKDYELTNTSTLCTIEKNLGSSNNIATNNWEELCPEKVQI